MKSVALGPLCLPCPAWGFERNWCWWWGFEFWGGVSFSCPCSVVTRGRCRTQLWLMKILLNLVGLEGLRLPIRPRLCWWDLIIFGLRKFGFIYLFILLLLFYLWVFWLVGLIGFAWFCAFMVQMWVFELGGGVQYSCDYEVWLLCSGVGMNCSDVGRKRETDRARGRREIWERMSWERRDRFEWGKEK